MTQKKQEYRVGVGASSLLMILVVLCLATLAILSYLSAATDEKFTLREVEMAEGAYAAEARAQEALAALDGLLLDETNGADAEALSEALSGAGFDAEAEAGDALRLSFDAGADRALVVRVRVRPEAGEGGARFQLLEHRVQSTLVETFDW